MSLYLGENLISGQTTLVGESRNIGQIIPSTIPLTDAGLHLLDGALIQGNGIYSAFVDYIASIVSTYPSVFTTESAWQSSVSTYGVCGKFVYDSTNNTVRLPKYGTQTITKTPTASTVPLSIPVSVNVYGNGKVIGLTNGASNCGLQDVSGGYAGGYSEAYGRNITTGQYGSTYIVGALGLTTNKNNSGIVGSGTCSGSINLANALTNYPLNCYYYIVIATSTKTDIQVDIDNVVSDLNGKADRDLSNISASQSAKDTVINWGMPDYSNKISISSGFVAPSKGWISINCFTQTANTDTYVYINGIAVTGIASGGGMVSNATQIPVDKNDTITYHNSLYTTLFFPMKGVD